MKLSLLLKLSYVYLRFFHLFLIVVVDHDNLLMPCHHLRLWFDLEMVAIAPKGKTLCFLLNVSCHKVVLVHFFVWTLVHLRHSKTFHPWVHHAIRIRGVKWVDEHA